MKNLINYVAILALLLSGCKSKNTDYSDLNYLAVKIAGSELWSILDAKTGEIIIDNEFKNQPTQVSNDGIFYVLNDENLWEVYNIKDPTKLLSPFAYKSIASFGENEITPTARVDAPINLVNKSFKVIANLDPDIKSCAAFSEDLAVIETQEGLMGYINRKGVIVIEAKYINANSFSNGIAIVTASIDNNGNKLIYAIDKNGNKIFQFSTEEYQYFGNFVNGYLPVIKDDKLIYLDKKGNKAFTVCKNLKFETSLKYNSKLDFYENLKIINNCTFSGKYIIFSDGENYGLKDKNNQILIRAKYEMLHAINEDLFMAQKNDKFGVIDSQDNVIIDFDYEELQPVNSKCIICVSKSTANLVSLKDGKDVGNINFTRYSLIKNYFAYSNYLNPREFAKSLYKELCEMQSIFSDDSTLKNYKTDVEDYKYLYLDKKSVTYDCKDKRYTLIFDRPLTKYTYEYFWGYRFRDDVVVDYRAKLKCVELDFDINEYDILENRITEEFDDILLKNNYKKNKNGWLNLPNGLCTTLFYENGIIKLLFGIDINDIKMPLIRNARKTRAIINDTNSDIFGDEEVEKYKQKDIFYDNDWMM